MKDCVYLEVIKLKNFYHVVIDSTRYKYNTVFRYRGMTSKQNFTSLDQACRYAEKSLDCKTHKEAKKCYSINVKRLD